MLGARLFREAGILRTVCPVDDLWATFARTRDPAVRNQLIVKYQFLVERVAKRQATRLPVAVEDLAGDGMFGLIDAVDKFDPARGVQFEAYAVQRIRGAMLDGIRALDWVPRSVRSKAHHISQATEALQGTLKREPTTGEVAEFAGLSEREVVRNWNERYRRSVDAYGQNRGLTDDQRHDNSQVTEQLHEIDALRDHVADVLGRFGEREQWLFALYYYEDLTLAEIGTVLGVTEARVCQIHTKAMEDLCSGITPR